MGTKPLLLFLSLFFINCKDDRKIKVYASFSNKEILLTSFSDQKALFAYVPIDVKIENNSLCEITSIDFFVTEKNGNYRYTPLFETSHKRFDYDYQNLDYNARAGGNNLKTVYLTYKISDSIFLKSEFKEDYDYIKKNNLLDNSFYNDTIRFETMNHFLKKHPNFALEKYGMTEEILEIEILKKCEDEYDFRETQYFNFKK